MRDSSPRADSKESAHASFRTVCQIFALAAGSSPFRRADSVEGRVEPTAVRFKLGSGRVGVDASRVGAEAAVFGAVWDLFCASDWRARVERARGSQDRLS